MRTAALSNSPPIDALLLPPDQFSTSFTESESPCVCVCCVYQNLHSKWQSIEIPNSFIHLAWIPTAEWLTNNSQVTKELEIVSACIYGVSALSLLADRFCVDAKNKESRRRRKKAEILMMKIGCAVVWEHFPIRQRQ